jgi:hypothetical protein
VSADVDAEALSITRLEGSRWRGGRLWSRELGSEAVGELEPRQTTPWIAARTQGSSGDHGAHRDENRHYTREWTHRYRGVPAHVGWMLMLAVRMSRHDVSKPRHIRASWCALRMGPRIIGAPHRGQNHAGAVGDASVSGGVRRSL